MGFLEYGLPENGISNLKTPLEIPFSGSPYSKQRPFRVLYSFFLPFFSLKFPDITQLYLKIHVSIKEKITISKLPKTYLL